MPNKLVLWKRHGRLVLVAAQPYSQSSPKFSALIGIQLASDTLFVKNQTGRPGTSIQGT